MKINVKIEVHCYQQDRLIDETFEAASMMILGTEAASCVKKNRSTEFLSQIENKYQRLSDNENLFHLSKKRYKLILYLYSSFNI